MGVRIGHGRGPSVPSSGPNWHSSAWGVAFRRSQARALPGPDPAQVSVRSDLIRLVPDATPTDTAELSGEPGAPATLVPRRGMSAAPDTCAAAGLPALLAAIAAAAGSPEAGPTSATDLDPDADPDATVAALVAAVTALTRADDVRVWSLDASRSLLHSPAVGGLDGRRDAVPLGTGIVGRCAAEGRPARGRTTGSRGSSAGAAPRPGDAADVSVVTRSHLVVPLTAAGRVAGVLDVAWAVGRAGERQAPTELDEQVGALAAFAATQLDLVRLRRAGAQAQDRDRETGALDAERLRRDLGHECARTHRYGQPFSLVVVQLDGVDESGRDSPLVVAVDLVGAHVRAADAVYRLGPSALAVLAPQTGGEGAAILAQRLAAVLGRRFSPVPGLGATTIPPVRVRVAWASVPADADGPDAVLLAARRGLGSEVDG